MGRPRTTGDWLANGDIKFNSLSRPSLSLSFPFTQSPRWLYNHQAPGWAIVVTTRPDGQRAPLAFRSKNPRTRHDFAKPKNWKRNKIKTWNSASTSQDAASLNQIKSIFGCFFLVFYISHFRVDGSRVSRRAGEPIELCVCGRGVTGRLSSASTEILHHTLAPLIIISLTSACDGDDILS